MSRARALAAYRHALRATKIAFNADVKLLNASRDQIRQGFYNPDESKSVEDRIKHLEDVSKFLLSNVVQATRNDTGRYRLNIHKDTELGDNESVKKAKAKLQEQGNGCCGGGAGLVN